MRFPITFVLACFLAAFVTSPIAQTQPASKRAAADGPTADSPAAAPRHTVTLFDGLKSGEDVIYLVSNSSFVWGPDPSGLSEEITFTGLVTVPKWPMKGYERRVLPDGREQIDIELSESQLKGESYLLGSTVKLGEHPDLRSLGTITSPPLLTAMAAAKPSHESPQQTASDGPQPQTFKVSADVAKTIQNSPQVLWGQLASDEIAKVLAMPPNRARRMLPKKAEGETQPVQLVLTAEVRDKLKGADLDSNLLVNKVLADLAADLKKNGGLEAMSPSQLVVPHDFVVARKVLLTTAKGVLYNETAVPVRGKLDSIPPIHKPDSPDGVDIFHGMELPIPLLDQDKNVDGWFYSKAHIAMPVHPDKIEKETVKADLSLAAGDRTEVVHVEGPAEIHHQAARTKGNRSETDVEVMVLALRGKSELLGGNVMVIEAFSDKDKYSRGHYVWDHNKPVASSLDLYLEVCTPSGKLHNEKPITVGTRIDTLREDGVIAKGNLRIPTVKAVGAKPFVSNQGQDLFNDAERAAVKLSNLRFEMVEEAANK